MWTKPDHFTLFTLQNVDLHCLLFQSQLAQCDGGEDGDDGDVNGERGGLMLLAQVFEPDQVFIQPGRSTNGDEVVRATGSLCIMSSAHSLLRTAPLLHDLPLGDVEGHVFVSLYYHQDHRSQRPQVLGFGFCHWSIPSGVGQLKDQKIGPMQAKQPRIRASQP